MQESSIKDLFNKFADIEKGTLRPKTDPDTFHDNLKAKLAEDDACSSVSSEKEIEYSFFVMMAPEMIAEIVAENSGWSSHVITEGKLGGKDGKYARLRTYHSTSGGEDTYEFTIKQKTGAEGGRTNVELNSGITKLVADYLYGTAESINLRRRVEMPIGKEGKPIIRANGEVLLWQVDVYYRHGEPIPWVKLELEVDKDTDADVLKYFPYAYTDIIPGNTTDPDQRALISHLYDVIYNIKA